LNSENLAVIFFGSQTGTAEDLAIRTQNDISSKLNIPCIVLDTDDYDMEELGEWKNFDSRRKWLVGFFMAT
jgi:NADPH-ferrihemoprotein reductase